MHLSLVVNRNLVYRCFHHVMKLSARELFSNALSTLLSGAFMGLSSVTKMFDLYHFVNVQLFAVSLISFVQLIDCFPFYNRCLGIYLIAITESNK